MMMITTMTMTATNDHVFLGNNQTWSDAFLAEGWWVIFYDDDKDEDANNGNDNEGGHFHCLFQKVLPMQSMAMLTVRTTTMTLFYDATTTSWSDAFLTEGRGV